MKSKALTGEQQVQSSLTQESCLMGPRHLEQIMRRVDSFGVKGPQSSRHAVSTRWREAQAAYEQLAVSEARAADDVEVKPLPRAMDRHVQKLLAMRGTRQSFATVPVAFGMVPLNQLIVSQYWLTQAVVDHVRAQSPALGSPARFAELCLPLEPIAADFRLVGQDKREFTFVADTHDMRFLGTQVLEPEQIEGLSIRGQPQSVVALGLGFSSNLLNVVRYNKRLVVNNGHHRAYALLSQGVTHAPCLIQACASLDDLEQIGTEELLHESDLYFDAPRPPLLKDFANPALTQSYLSPRFWRQVTVTVNVESRLLAL